MPRRAFPTFAVAVFAVGAVPAFASFHLWDIQEIYSNSDGTVQFIELFTTADFQNALSGRMIISSQGGSSVQFVFPGSLEISLSGITQFTASRHILLATAAFASQPGAVKPEFILPDGFLFSPGGAVEFVLADSQSYTMLPTDGILSLNFPSGAAGVNSPTNFAGDQGSLTGATATPTPSPTASPTPTPTPTPIPILPGDVSGDGRLTLIDIEMLEDHLLGRMVLDPGELLRADGNEDGNTDVADLIYIQRNLD